MQDPLMIPRQITVKVTRDSSGYIAELPEYNAHTEASGIYELFFQINDLIYGIFDIAPEYRKSIKYAPESLAGSNNLSPSRVSFKKYISPEVASIFC